MPDSLAGDRVLFFKFFDDGVGAHVQYPCCIFNPTAVERHIHLAAVSLFGIDLSKHNPS